MNTTIGVGASRGRISLVALEAVEVPGQRRLTKVVTFAERLRQNVSPADVREDVRRLTRAIREQASNPGRNEPRVVVLALGSLSAVADLLREDYASTDPDVRRKHRPTAITTWSASNDPRVERVTPIELASRLYTEYVSGRVEFAPGLGRLASQMRSFVPVESRSGTLSFGNEDMSEYDDSVVALMLAVAGSGRFKYGDPRFRDARRKEPWPSRAAAMGYWGSAQAMQRGGAVTRSTSYGTTREEVR